MRVAKPDSRRGQQLERVDPGATLGLERGTTAICIPLFRQHDVFLECLDSILRHTSPEIPILVADDGSPDDASERYLDELGASGALRHRLVYLRQPENVGFVVNVNTAFAALAAADVVIVNSDVVVGAEWLERLRAAAYSDTNIATATALTNHGTILSVPERNEPQTRLPRGITPAAAAEAIAAAASRIRPRIPTAIGHCTYIRRDALDLVGDFDETFSPGYGEEVDFSQRCAAHGLSHVAADDVFVFHHGGRSFRGVPLRAAHEAVIDARYPFYAHAVSAAANATTGPLPRALAAARAAIAPLSITIDARFLGRTITGTQIQALELIHALWRTRRADVRVVLSSALRESDRSLLRDLDGLECIDDADVQRRPRPLPRADVVHRLSQIFSWDDLSLIPHLGNRFVITQLDLIAYRNPTYATTYGEWRQYQQLTRLSLALADCVVFMSEHPARDAIAEELVDERRARVVHLGVDHHVARASAVRRPTRLPNAASENFLLCIGTNFRHKNRVFALRLLEALQRRHNWDGWLVFAGPHASVGASDLDESAFLRSRPEVAARVTDLEAVAEDEKLWLFREAKGVVFPSTYEGFGLVPFEAAEQGTPCFHAYQTSLRDTLPAESATLVPWDADTSAEAVARVLREPQASDALVEVVRRAARELTWARTAEGLLDVYADVVRAPHREVTRLADMSVPVSLDALTSAKSGDFADVPAPAYRALRAFAGDHRTRGVFLGTVETLYAVAYFLRFGRRPPPVDASA